MTTACDVMILHMVTKQHISGSQTTADLHISVISGYNYQNSFGFFHFKQQYINASWKQTAVIKANCTATIYVAYHELDAAIAGQFAHSTYRHKTRFITLLAEQLRTSKDEK